MPKEFIVAIELGSSKMTGMAGQKNLDGSITVLATVEEDSSSCIRKGVIYNIDKTCLCLTNIVKKLQNILKQEITQVYVGVGGRSIHCVKNVVVKDLPSYSVISQDMVDQLMDINRNMSYPDQEILNAATQEYKIDNQYQADPVGIQGNHLEGVYLNILWRKNYYNNINTCFENANIAIAEMYLAPLAMADSVLTDTEKRTGCMLVDLGADTTTVSVYYKNILRHLSVVPLGSSNITRDLTSLQIEEAEAERMKLEYGKAYTEPEAIDETLSYRLDNERTVESKKFIDIVEARALEIVSNAWYQVPKDLKEKLVGGGIILTGGGSNMPGMATLFKRATDTDKVRIAKFVTLSVNSKDAKLSVHDGTKNTILSLLAKGDMNCAGEEIRTDLFANQDNKVLSNETHKAPRNPNDTLDKGVVPTAADKQKAEEILRQKKEEEEAAARIAEEQEKIRLAKEKKEKSILHRIFRAGKKFVTETIADEDM